LVPSCMQVLVTAASNTAVNNLAEQLMKDKNLELLRVCQLDRLDEKVSTLFTLQLEAT